MGEENDFISLSVLIGEAARAKMLWNLLDGRAYTATELAYAAGISTTSASNHLSKLLESDLLQVEIQGRHRYFSFARPEVAYVIESLASLTEKKAGMVKDTKKEITGIKYCRTCYDHLAGNVGVRITEALEQKKMIKKSGREFIITKEGWKWLSKLDILPGHASNARRPLIRQCLDWSERRPHMAGQVGALLLTTMLEKNWMRKVQFSRELIVTAKGKTNIYNLLGIEV
jgi:DNA-binding transcriptional ArsR family regulator